MSWCLRLVLSCCLQLVLSWCLQLVLSWCLRLVLSQDDQNELKAPTLCGPLSDISSLSAPPGSIGVA